MYHLTGFNTTFRLYLVYFLSQSEFICCKNEFTKARDEEVIVNRWLDGNREQVKVGVAEQRSTK